MRSLSVTTESVLCRIEHKELQAAADKHADISEAMMTGLKMNLDMQNGIRAQENLKHQDDQRPVVSLREWGCLIVRIGLCAIAASEEEEAEDE